LFGDTMETWIILTLAIIALFAIFAAKGFIAEWMCANPKILGILVTAIVLATICYIATSNDCGLIGFINDNSSFFLVFIQIVIMFVAVASKHYVLGTALFFTSLVTLMLTRPFVF